MTDVDLGGVVLTLIPVGAAHTSGSMIVEVRQDDVVFAGDALYDGRLLAVLPVSRGDKWIHAFKQLRTTVFSLIDAMIAKQQIKMIMVSLDDQAAACQSRFAFNP